MWNWKPVMYDPCTNCKCVLHREVCRKFCTIYKEAIRRDVREGMAEIGRELHRRYIQHKNGR